MVILCFMNRKVYLLLSILFIDFFSFATIIPLIPLLFLKSSYGIIPSEVSTGMRYVLLGALLSIYPLGQIFSAPLLGSISDQRGRKITLLFSYLGNSLCYLLFIVGIWNHSTLPLFLGNFLAGVTGANISTSNAIISDLTSQKERSRWFALSQCTIGLGFMAGPYLSNIIHSSSGSALEATYKLFTISMLSTLTNFFLIQYGWPSESGSAPPIKIKICWKEIFSTKGIIRNILTAEFFIFFGWYLFIKTFQIFLIQQIRCSELEVSSTYSQYGLWFLLSELVFFIWLHRYIKFNLFFYLSTIVLSGSLFSLFFITKYSHVCWMVPLFTSSYALLMPALTNLLSDYALNNGQGKTMGLHQSVQALAKLSAPLVAGIIISITPKAIMILSPICIISSCWILKLVENKKREGMEKLERA